MSPPTVLSGTSSRTVLRLSVCALALVALVACSTDGSEPQVPADQTTGVAVVSATRQDLTSVLVVSGTTSAQPAFLLRAGSAGELGVLVEAGEPVEAGQQLAAAGGSEILTPVRATVADWLLPSGTAIEPDLPVATLSYTGFGVSLVVPAEEAYRLYSVPQEARATVTGGPGGVACDLLPGLAQEQADGGSAPAFECLFPIDTSVMAGLPARVAIETAHIDDALVLPVEAVSGDTGSGVVTLVDDGERREVTVQLGISDGHLVQIVEGLSEGDEVLAYAPVLGG